MAPATRLGLLRQEFDSSQSSLPANSLDDLNNKHLETPRRIDSHSRTKNTFHGHTMSLHLRPATVEDIPQLCDVYFSAFANEPITEQTLPKASGTGRAFVAAGLTKDIQSDEKKHVLVITDSVAADPAQIMAFAKWVEPGAEIHDPPPASAWPQDGNPDIAVHFFGNFSRAHRRIMGEGEGARKHWYLELLLTRREASGRGAGRKLIEWGVEKADDGKLPCYLEATKEAEAMYEKKFGFEVVQRDSVRHATGEVDVSMMTREPAQGLQ